MLSAIQVTTRVQPGGRIEIIDSRLPLGARVEVIVLIGEQGVSSRRSVMDVLAEALGHLAFQTAEEVDAAMKAEREGWQ